MRSEKESRRAFIKKTALVTAGIAATSNLGFPAILNSRSPNDMIGIGVLGFGIRARQMMNALGHFHPRAPDRATGFGTISREDRTRGYGSRKQKIVKPFNKEKIRVVCDVYQDALKYASEMFKKDVKFVDNYKKVLEDPDIDAVLIFTPDHWHAQMAIDACEAGKDVFIEKCPTHHFREGVALKTAVESNKRVLQLNESSLHSPMVKKMQHIVRSGAIGSVHLVECTWHIPAKRRIWDWPIPSDLSPETIDWQGFLGPAPKVAFDPKRVIQWRCYWDYGTGVCGDLFSHSLADINTIMELHIPETAVASGGTYALTDYFHIPDLYASVYEYPEREVTLVFSANFATSQRRVGITYNGTRASMTSGRGEIHINKTPGQSGEDPLEIIKVEPDSEMSSLEKHFHEFFTCIRTREKTTCDMNMCFGEDISCHMGTEAFHRGTKVSWDSDQMEIV